MAEATVEPTAPWEVGANATSQVNFSVPPPLAPLTRELSGELVPITRIGTEKVAELPEALAKVPTRWPKDAAEVGEVRLVCVLESRSLNDAWTAVTWGTLKDRRSARC